MAVAAWCTAGFTYAQLPAFPGAEGFGGTFSGTPPAGGWFSNATVYRVTNLNDTGPGSFRNAFQENSSNRIIVFDVGGTIQLGSTLNIKNLANYYIAGQTAPSPVTIYGNTTQLTHSSGKENRNVVLRYLSFRKGTGDGSDSITFAGSGLGTNLILDHVSASWSEDEILSVANNNTNVTVQYTTIHDALDNSHAYGSLIRPRIDSNVTFHHNLYAHNASRQARFGTYNGETLTADFRNNVVYNFRDRASYTGGSSEAEQEQTDVNFVGNYIIAGPGTQGDPNVAYSVDKNVDTRVYQSGNFIDPDDAPGGTPADGVLDGSDTGWNMFRINNQTDQTLTQMATPFATPPVTTQTATDAYHQVIDHVGNWWWQRDAIDARVIANVVNFTGVPIGASAPIASELTSLLNAPQVNHPAGYDTDGDGMADEWEIAHGLNPASGADWNLDFDSDGYINLIEFINEKGEFPAPAPIVFTGDANSRYASILNWKTDDGGLSAGTNWQPGRWDTAEIRSGTVVVDAVGQHAGVLQIAPNGGDVAALQVSSGWLMAHEEVQVGGENGIGTLTVDAGGTLIAPLISVGEDSELLGDGAYVGSIANNGTVSYGSSPSTLLVAGNYSQTESGRVVIEVASASEFDRVVVDGDLEVGGILELNLLGGYLPSGGEIFDLLDWTGMKSGMFAQLDLPDLGALLAWDTSDLETAGVLAVVSAAPILGGDYNDDGVVDLADYTVWRDNLGAASGTLANDIDGGVVDGRQLATWKANFGITATDLAIASTVATVPEPATLALVALGVLPGVCWRWFSRTQRFTTQ